MVKSDIIIYDALDALGISLLITVEWYVFIKADVIILLKEKEECKACVFKANAINSQAL